MTLIAQLIQEQRRTEADLEQLSADLHELKQMVADMDRRQGEMRDVATYALSVARRQLEEKNTLMVHMGYLWLANSGQRLTESEQAMANKSNELAKQIAGQYRHLLGR